MVKCPNCGSEAGEGAIFCDQCGARLEIPSAPAGSVICPACGAGNVPGEAYCENCGAPLEAPTPAEAPPTPAPAAVEAGATCPACGGPVSPGEAFCSHCGADLTAPLPPAPSVAAEAPPIEAPPPPLAAPTCPACGGEVEAGDAFCSHCGAALAAPPPEAPPVPKVIPPPPPPVVPEAAPVEVPPPPPPPAAQLHLVIVDSGAQIPLPRGQTIIIGREDPVSGIYPEIDLTPHGGEEGGVSRQHARITVEDGGYFIEDLNSTNFTFVNRQKLTPGVRHPLNDGDEIRCGRVKFTFSYGGRKR